jgi:hypothetical protein
MAKALFAEAMRELKRKTSSHDADKTKPAGTKRIERATDLGHFTRSHVEVDPVTKLSGMQAFDATHRFHQWGNTTLQLCHCLVQEGIK